MDGWPTAAERETGSYDRSRLWFGSSESVRVFMVVINLMVDDRDFAIFKFMDVRTIRTEYGESPNDDD